MPIDIYDPLALEQLRADKSIDPRQLRDFRNAFFKHFVGSRQALQQIPASARQSVADQVQLHALELESRLDSKQDGATKLIFRTPEGDPLESVILRATTGRTALCLSTQIGCQGACVFCATGRMGMVANLNPATILDQLVQANELLRAESRQVRNIVFMGMGEPFHNERHLYQALEFLLAPVYFHHPPRYILISTVGIPDAMIRCAQRFPTINIALSLHSPRQKVRERLIPLARKYPVDRLRRTIQRLNGIQQRPLFVEYLMLAGINDSEADADALIGYLAGLDVHVNLIPYNRIDDGPGSSGHAGSPRSVRDFFATRLKSAGLTTTIRYSLGNDIAAACGQLAQRGTDRIR